MGISGGKFPLSKCPANTLRNLCSCFMCEQGSRDHRAGGFLSSILLLSILSKPGYLQGTSLKVMNYFKLIPFFFGGARTSVSPCLLLNITTTKLPP
jgi:hypothetical protein